MNIFKQIYFNHKGIFYIILILSLSIIIFLLFNFNKLNVDKLVSIDVEIAGKHISALVSDDVKSRKVGLSILDEISENEAMLFVFDKDGYHQFWMKDMKFAIDIVWLDKNKKVLFIKEQADPQDYPEIYKPDVVSFYVLEFKEGFVNENNIQIGNQFNWAY